VALVLAMLFSSDLLAQGFTTNSAGERKHRDFVGNVCLGVNGTSQPLASNPKIFNHVVSVENRCAERIKVRICYHGTDSCSDVEVPGRSHKEQVIGVFPAMRLFQYDVKEQF
jgi:hypothetical protein